MFERVFSMPITVWRSIPEPGYHCEAPSLDQYHCHARQNFRAALILKIEDLGITFLKSYKMSPEDILVLHGILGLRLQTLHHE